jgi:integrase
MPHKVPRYVQQYRDNRGTMRFYYRRKGYGSVTLPPPWEPGFQKAYEAAAAKGGPKPISPSRIPKGGTLGSVIVKYLDSAEYRALSDATKGTYRRLLDHLRAQSGDDRVADFRPDHIHAMINKRAKEGGPEAGNGLRNILKIVFKHAVKLNLRKDDPTEGIKKVRRQRGSKLGYRTWSEEDIAAFEARYPLGTPQYLALCLLLYTGQRRGDVVKLGPKHVKGKYDPKDFTGRSLSIKQQKTGQQLILPIHPKLAEALVDANVPADAPTFLRTQYGQPASAAGLTNRFREYTKEAGIHEQASPHGLRKAAARRLAEAGCSEKEIAAITGHTTLKEVAHYTKAANQERLAEQAMAKVRIGS